MEAPRRLHVFDKKLVQVCNNGNSAANFESIVDTTGSDSFLWLLESYGIIYALFCLQGTENKRNVLTCHSFKGFELEAIRIFYCPKASVLVVIGKDEESNHMLKFNSYRVIQKYAHENPDALLQFIQSVPLFSQADGLAPDNVQSVAVSQCSTVAVVATSKGSIYIYHNYLLPAAEGSAQSKANLTKFNINDIKTNRDIGAVRSIYIRRRSDGCFALAICCDYAVLSVKLGCQPDPSYIDFMQSRFETSCEFHSENGFALAQTDGVTSFYDIDSGVISSLRGCGPCSSICFYKGYIASAAMDTTNCMENFQSTTLVTVKSIIHEMDFLAYSQYILVVLKFEAALGSLYLLTRSGTNNSVILFELREKGVKERIQILVRKRLFDWAVRIATLEKRPVAEREEVHKLHANWLYEKGDFNGALEAYCKAGSSVEPAFVIERFMSIHSKVPVYNYLLHLHKSSMATNVHTSLLMRVLQSLFKTYYDDKGASATREVDCPALLVDFLHNFGESHKDGIRDTLYECRSSGGSEFARIVALAQEDHEEYVNILVEDFQDYKTALEHLNSVDTQVVLNAILKHGRRLVLQDPQSVMKLIRKVCESIPQTHGSVHEAFVPVFAMEDKFLGDMLGIDSSNSSILIFSTRLQLMLDELSNHSCRGDVKERGASSGNFDEEVLENRLWNLLNANTQQTDSQLIALALCLIYRYQRGAIAMAIKMGYYHLPLVLAGMPDSQVTGNKFNLLQHALSYGYNEPTLWVETLSLLIRSSEDTSELIRNALQHIHTHKLLSFPSVMNILKTNSKLRFSEVKGYLRNEFRKIDGNIKDYRKEISQDKEEYTQMNQYLQRLQHSYFVVNNTNCSRCELYLEMPSLHFYCQHSFHSYCVGPGNVCPKCSMANQDSGDNQDKHESENQDSFFKFLRGATDPFDYMTQQIERFSLC